MKDDIEEIKKKYIAKAHDLIDELGYLNIIYLRVSTTDKGQEELDQLRDVLNTFNLDKKDCLIIRSKESAYKPSKQSARRFNVIREIIQSLDPKIEKNCYFWSIDRIYRNRELLTNFYDMAKSNNTRIYSYMEAFINQLAEMQNKLPEGMGFIIEIQVNMLVNFFGWIAEHESKIKSERVKKSLVFKQGRYITNKGNLPSCKIKRLNGKPVKDVETLAKLEEAILKRVKADKMSYTEIAKLITEKTKIRISRSFICRVKQKYLGYESVAEYIKLKTAEQEEKNKRL